MKSLQHQNGVVASWRTQAQILLWLVAAIVIFYCQLPAKAATTGVILDSGASNPAVLDTSEKRPQPGQLVVTSRADSGKGTLREALALAASGDTITFRVRGTILVNSPLVVDKDLVIQGPGVQRLRLDGQLSTYIFLVTSNATATIADLTLTNAYNSVFSAEGSGGAVRNLGHLTMTRCVVTDSTSEFGIGGGIFSSGTLNLFQCSISNNAAVYGGGIGDEGDLLMNSSTVNANRTADPSGSGGAGILKSTGLGLFTNVTVSGNFALDGNGGGILSSTPIYLENCTIVSNTATSVRTGASFGRGGGLALIGVNALAELKNTLVAGNVSAQFFGTVTQSVGPDCFGPLLSDGWNLIQNPVDAIISGDLTGNILEVDPRLGPLRGNGGPTRTHALLSGSPAIDSASSTDFPPTDQRGVARPQDGDGDKISRADIGAYERRLRERGR